MILLQGPALEIVASVLRLIVLHQEATPPEQRAAQAQQWNIFWDQVGRVLLKPAGIDLPPIPVIPIPEPAKKET